MDSGPLLDFVAGLTEIDGGDFTSVEQPNESQRQRIALSDGDQKGSIGDDATLRNAPHSKKERSIALSSISSSASDPATP